MRARARGRGRIAFPETSTLEMEPRRCMDLGYYRRVTIGKVRVRVRVRVRVMVGVRVI